MMIACGDFVIPGNKMPPNNAEAEAAYAIFIDMIENGWLTVSSESLVDGKTRIRWELLKEQDAMVVTTADFENNPNLDDSNHLNVWEEYRDGTRCGWNTININDVGTFTDIRRYWTSRPTEEQRKAVKWND